MLIMKITQIQFRFLKLGSQSVCVCVRMCRMRIRSGGFRENKNPLSILRMDPLFLSRQSYRIHKCESNIKLYLSRSLRARMINIYVSVSEGNK